MKKLIRYLLILMGTIFILISLLLLVYKASVQNTLKHNIEIQVMFDSTAKHIASLEKLPTYQEFKNWANSQKVSIIKYQFLQYEMHNENFTLNKKIPKDEYILSMWRGEWNEYYYSWKEKKSTIHTDESAYSFTGYILGDSLLFFLIGLLFLKISSFLKKELASFPLS